MIKLCLFCKKQFNTSCNKDFCDDCRAFYGIHVSRIYKLSKRKIIKNCLWCGNKFELNKYPNILYCEKCKSLAILRWKLRNPERVKEIMIKYRKSHLKLCRERTRLSEIKRRNKLYFGGLKYEALKRDKYICQKCGKDISMKYMSCVHHINFNKSDNRIENLITLCRSCHPIIHYSQRTINKFGQFAK